MDYQHTGDIESAETARLAQAGVTPTANDSSTPLLTTSILTSGEVEASQPLPTNNKEEPPTPLPPVPATILFIVMFLPFIIILGSLPALALSKQDPLGFSFLAFLLLFSLVPCGLGIAFLMGVMDPATQGFFDLIGIDRNKLHPKQRELPGYLVFSWGLLVFYLIFYSTAWIWASSRTVADLIDDHGVWKDFQAKVNVPDALDLLTRCLYDNVQGWATVEDFAFCAKDIGIKSTGG
ncbi:hypothetical protein B0J15DRAFT_506599 [Fusarium solani]|uniref:Uncharacterized protein n=1 Tax=Fusarium solani TaxID=169388 RepID=A0A9P9G016_FUSSL|nr:uncharacterized protein B0J15DRAFT_506599 [Fusarium solani]KAH7228390.1 hypothetical protein B0J15DRAFT_506599 [Fusarium solani]